ncbi:helix-turn-helix domain-containing protein [Methylomonas sp. HW2-6]|uniref:helix-turn-helix domain-containing protein n=1 Tax=Methylomonas sp. HW2-6 TaxID=3376687 RepID=UPI0040432485
MIRCYLSRILGERRLKISDVARDTDINRGTITRLYHETFTRIEIDVVNTLCKYLQCRIEDLFEFLPDEKDGDDY